MEEIDKNLIDPAVEPESEKVHRVVRSSLASLPILGSASLEIFNSIIEPPMNKRKTKWRQTYYFYPFSVIEQG